MLKILWIAVVGILTLSLLRTLWLSYQSQGRLEETQRRVEQLEAETAGLEEQVRSATASFTLEKRAREELELHREGEVVLPVEP